ncbi:MAG: hypothetical protein ACTHJ5_00330 [Ilyomonas sp.]
MSFLISPKYDKPAIEKRYVIIFKIERLAKKSFVLRIDEYTYTALEKWAADEFRSVNGQIEFLLDKALKNSGRKTIKEKEPKSTKK